VLEVRIWPNGSRYLWTDAFGLPGRANNINWPSPAVFYGGPVAKPSPLPSRAAGVP
jgi:hypothetical protein